MQKRCNNTEIAAAAKEKRDREADAEMKTQWDRSQVVSQIAQLEDIIQKEDKFYRDRYKVCGKNATSKTKYREAKDNPVANLR